DLAEGRLDIAPLVIVREKFLTTIREIAKHLGPCPAARAGVITAERNVWRGTHGRYRLRVDLARVSLVGRNLRDGEIARRRLDEWRGQRGVVGILAVEFKGGLEVCVHGAAYLELDPTV